MTRIVTVLLFCLAGHLAHGASLYESTNLEAFGVPDVLAEGVRPYDQRIITDMRIAGKRCCQRDMYRTGGHKIVLLSHEGQYFLAFLITGEHSRMFVATSQGTFEERSMEEGARWSVPDWLRAKSENADGQ